MTESPLPSFIHFTGHDHKPNIVWNPTSLVSKLSHGIQQLNVSIYNVSINVNSSNTKGAVQAVLFQREEKGTDSKHDCQHCRNEYGVSAS